METRSLPCGTRPVADTRHAEHACRCALAVEERLEAFNSAQRASGLPEFRTRFGIHTGTAVVGSVGAKERLQYTAMGDTVNVASRLEGMNKDYGTSVLASGAVVAQCKDMVKFRPLGTAKAKGRSTALDIYEVVGVVPHGEHYRSRNGRLRKGRCRGERRPR
jgi:adenylate cyclase